MKDGRFPKRSRDARRADYWRGLAVGMWISNQNENKNPNPTPNRNGNGGCSKGCLWAVWIVFCFFAGCMLAKCSSH